MFAGVNGDGGKLVFDVGIVVCSTDAGFEDSIDVLSALVPLILDPTVIESLEFLVTFPDRSVDNK